MSRVYRWLNIKRICVFCLAKTHNAHELCSACELDLPWNTCRCECCGLPLADPQAACIDCAARQYDFARTIAPFVFDFPMDTAIAQFKHQQNWPLGKLMAQLMARELQHRYMQGLAKPDVLVAMPLSSTRLRQRGFNQAQMLADWLACELKIKVYAARYLVRQEAAAQQTLNASQRQANLQGVFSFKSVSSTLQHKQVAIVDDVMTTGASAQALTQLLLSAGARRVDIYCVARTPKSSQWQKA